MVITQRKKSMKRRTYLVRNIHKACMGVLLGDVDQGHIEAGHAISVPCIVGKVLAVTNF